MGLFSDIIKSAKKTIKTVASNVANQVLNDNTGSTVGKIVKTAATVYALKKAYDYFTTPDDPKPQPVQQISNAPAVSPATSSQAAGTTTNTIITGTGSYQMSASGDFSIPILYGRSQVRGAVFDAIMTQGNTHLLTGLMLAERTGADPYGNATYTVNKVYFNDVELNLNANGTVANGILSDGTVTTKYNDNTNVFIYAGSSTTKPTTVTGQTPTYAAATSIMPHWDTKYRLGGAVFAIIEQTYDAANGVQGLGTWTFDITNDTHKNPGVVTYDYLTNARYGAGYDANNVNSNSFIGSAETSIKSIGDQLDLFTSFNSADNANANIANSTAYPQFVTAGNINNYTTFTLGTYDDAVSNVTANAMQDGSLTTAGNVVTDAVDFNRLKIFWANTTVAGNINNSLTSNNSFTAFLDIARAVPDGSNAGYSVANSEVANAQMYPGDVYDFAGVLTGSNTNVVPSIAPNTTITNFLTKGDKIRPEGSPFIYTVAANVDVPNAGYETFEIPVIERIRKIDFANTDFGDANANTVINSVDYTGNAAVLYEEDYDTTGYYYYGGWPFTGATANGAVTYPNEYTTESNVLFSNCLVGNVVMTTPQTDTVYLGEQPRIEINGLLSTDRTVEENLTILLAHSEATLKYDIAEGEWVGVPLANSNISTAYEFTDDNIIGSIDITTSEFESLFNRARAYYIDKNHNSVREETVVYTPQEELNTYETPKQMELNYPLTNNTAEASRKARMELAQNRNDLVIKFSSDYSSIIVKPGDIVKVTVASYGFNQKTFKILSATQSMSTDILVMNFSAIEWDEDIYFNTSGIGANSPTLDDIEFDPEEYDDLTDGSGTNYPDGSVPGGAVQANTLPGNAIVDGSITEGKLGFAIGGVAADSIALNSTLSTSSPGSLGLTTDIEIVGSSSTPGYVTYDIPTSGLYTFTFTFINPFGHNDLSFFETFTQHDHAAGSLNVNGNFATGNTAYNSPQLTPRGVFGNVVYLINQDSANYIDSTLGGNLLQSTDQVRFSPSKVVSNVSIRWKHPDFTTDRDQNFIISGYGQTGGPVTLSVTLNCEANTTANIYNWSATYSNMGVPSKVLSWKLPTGFGNASPTLTQTAGSGNEGNVYVVAPTITVASAGGFTLG